MEKERNKNWVETLVFNMAMKFAAVLFTAIFGFAIYINTQLIVYKDDFANKLSIMNREIGVIANDIKTMSGDIKTLNNNFNKQESKKQ